MLRVAHDTVELLSTVPPMSTGALTTRGLRVSAAALDRLGMLLDLQARVLTEQPDACRLLARAVLETWITGHAALLLDADGFALLQRRSEAATTGTIEPVPTLVDLARALDQRMYGTADPPRAFQRHVASFSDEIDISGVEGTLAWFSATPGSTRATARDAWPTGHHMDHVRVCLWVVLFLAHDHYATAGAAEPARAARALFDRLRHLTDDFYAQRRKGPARSSD